ncbi:MaoC family dehydratase [Pseudonocardia pini]|uniref:MaoC family dehydratase n=1 Tax=Pseudonocardia pini TaxID=2758030 RepID=UPI0015F096F4|nr:MaoC/PaaZ C-terminal domain-containing protein [Pseudonocardia pini]
MSTDVATTPPAFRDLVVGTVLPPFERTPTKVQLVMYAGAEDDYMPVHFDHDYAVAAGQPGVINHGWLTYALLLQSVTSWLPPDVARIVRTRSRYLRPTFPGRPVVCAGTVVGLREEHSRRLVDVHVEATDGQGVVTTTADATLAYL